MPEGNKGFCPSGGWCVLKGLPGQLQSPRPGHINLGGQTFLRGRRSVRPKGLEGGCSLQGPGTPAWGTGGLAEALVGAS